MTMKWTLDTWNNRIRGVTIGIMGEVPVVGTAISMMMEVFWPSDQANSDTIWAQLQKQTQSMIDKAILQQEIRKLTAKINSLRDALDEYVHAGIKDKSAKLEIALHNADEIHNDIAVSANKIHLLPLASTAAYMHFLMLRERHLFADKIYSDPAAGAEFRLAKFRYLMETYFRFFDETYPKWLKWRMQFIEVKRETEMTNSGFGGSNYYTVYFKARDKKINRVIEYQSRMFTLAQWPTVIDDYQDVRNAEKKLGRLVKPIQTLFEADAVRVMMYAYAPIWDIQHLLPEAVKNKQDVVPKLKELWIGPLSGSTIGWTENGVFTTKMEDRPGTINQINLRAGDLIDAMQFEYEGHRGHLAGNSAGGTPHQIEVPDGARVCGAKLGFYDRQIRSIQFIFSNGEVSKEFGNRAKLKTAEILLEPSSAFEICSARFRTLKRKNTTGIGVISFNLRYRPPQMH